MPRHGTGGFRRDGLPVTGTLDMEDEEVSGVVVDSIEERVEELVLRVTPVEVDVLGCAGSLGHPQVERETTFEHPAIRGDYGQPSQQPVESHTFAVPRQPRAVTGRAFLEPPLNRLPKRRGVPVSHTVASLRICSTNPRTRSDRPAVAARSRRGVVRPRSSAWRTASATCSGWVPA